MGQGITSRLLGDGTLSPEISRCLLGRKGLVVWLLLDFLSSIRKAVVGSLYS
jgi:hypothetical protein